MYTSVAVHLALGPARGSAASAGMAATLGAICMIEALEELIVCIDIHDASS